ncbi:hypothetical protein JOE31_001498 [Arthrobacter sp. PvP023]|nr:hypothetical protein [Arthrobacter sp. PvP023]MBP1135266.1 hypothetical protein [Arthrobacter sp. PvP023]
MPYVDINPHRPRRPRWLAHVGLSVLTVATLAVVTLALHWR